MPKQFLWILSGMLLLLSMPFSLCADDSIAPPPDARFKVDMLLVVAHPDDETEIGSYLAHLALDEKKRIAVVFGTRGNGGGNAEGQEQAAALGVIREIEARKAVAHFGISEVWFLNGLDTPGQDVLDSLETWNHGDSLERLIRIVRLTQPSVIVTWLPDWVAGENHGDHQAAGVIATEAFDMAGDPTVFAEQLSTPRNRQDIRNLTEGLRPWQTQKLYYMTDAAHTEFLKDKGPMYTPNEKTARLATEECAFHLTQGDTGQEARAALAKGDLRMFEQPEYLIFGKSYVSPDVMADVFAGVKEEGIGFRRAPGFSADDVTGLHVELGGPWRFYRQFWQAHGTEQLKSLLGPEIYVKPGAFFTFPIVVENATASAMDVKLTVELPAGWSFRRKWPESVAVPAGGTISVPFEVKTGDKESAAWQTVKIRAMAGGKDIGEISVKAMLNGGAMPQ